MLEEMDLLNHGTYGVYAAITSLRPLPNIYAGRNGFIEPWNPCDLSSHYGPPPPKERGREGGK